MQKITVSFSCFFSCFLLVFFHCQNRCCVMDGSFSPMQHNKVGRYTLFFTYRVPLYALGAGWQGRVFFQNVFMALFLRAPFLVPANGAPLSAETEKDDFYGSFLFFGVITLFDSNTSICMRCFVKINCNFIALFGHSHCPCNSIVVIVGGVDYFLLRHASRLVVLTETYGVSLFGQSNKPFDKFIPGNFTKKGELRCLTINSITQRIGGDVFGNSLRGN